MFGKNKTPEGAAPDYNGLGTTAEGSDKTWGDVDAGFFDKQNPGGQLAQDLQHDSGFDSAERAAEEYEQQQIDAIITAVDNLKAARAKKAAAPEKTFDTAPAAPARQELPPVDPAAAAAEEARLDRDAAGRDYFNNVDEAVDNRAAPNPDPWENAA